MRRDSVETRGGNFRDKTIFLFEALIRRVWKRHEQESAEHLSSFWTTSSRPVGVTAASMTARGPRVHK